jgi:hypothetical protein
MWGNILFLQSWLSILSERMYYFSVKICTVQVTGLISLLREKDFRAAYEIKKMFSNQSNGSNKSYYLIVITAIQVLSKNHSNVFECK